ncbi:MAG: hypothetical protein P8M07_02890 [Flavobacteriales bacterium]|nr:hypothetical protein [Flavobacteriales bacterium]
MQRTFPFLFLLSSSLVLAFMSVGYYVSRGHADALPPDPTGAIAVDPPAAEPVQESRGPEVLWTLEEVGESAWVGRMEVGTKSIFLVQNQAHKVWAFRGDGSVAWSLDLSSSLQGWGVIDGRGDGHKQVLLADQAQVYSVAISGGHLESYPVHPGAAISAFEVVDYDGDGNYRALIGLENGQLLNHKKQGEASGGWRHDRRPAAIQTIGHIRAGKKDYICTVDAGGTVMLLKRTGARRVRTPAALEAMASGREVAYDLAVAIENCGLVTRKASGEVVRVDLGSGLESPVTASNAASLDAEKMPAWLVLTAEGPARLVLQDAP